MARLSVRCHQQRECARQVLHEPRFSDLAGYAGRLDQDGSHEADKVLAAKAQRPDAAMTNILYVEDNDDDVYLLKMRVELTEGLALAVAKDGAQAIASVAADRPDIILMDLNVPIIDGWEATRRLQADAKTARIPIIALTAHAMAGDRERALAAGCDDFDTKPLDFDRLLNKIRALIGDQRGP